MLRVENLERFTSPKILSFEDARKKISELKAKGKTVGLCHGGFDLTHPGHAIHFESAKKLCDFLFVSITSDRFVSKRKGSGRPVYTDRLRAYMVACMESVDYSVVTDYEKGVAVIKELQPSFYIKGPDFISKTTPGITAERQAIADIGGKMKYTGDPKLSTTDIIKYIKEELDRKHVLVCLDRDGTLIRNNNFFGKSDNWKNELELNKPVIDFLISLNAKFSCTFIVISNQAGVAKGYFSKERVQEINSYLDEILSKAGVRIASWQFCPDVDRHYAEQMKGKIDFLPSYVKESTKRKPGIAMVTDALESMGKRMTDYASIIVVGDRHEDAGLAAALKASFIDVRGKEYGALVKEADSCLV